MHHPPPTATALSGDDEPQAEARDVVIVANPKAGAGPAHEQIERLAKALSAQNFVPHIEYDLSAVNPLARELDRAGRLRVVVAAGGDGTVAEVINRTELGVPITVFPLGTENLLAKYLGMPREPEWVAEIIAAGAMATQDRPARPMGGSSY